MLKKTVTTALILFLSVAWLPAKNRSIPLENFASTDIGNPAIAGTAKIQKKKILINAGGADIWGVRDECHFSCIVLDGDFDFVARIQSLTAPHLYTKAGLMAREEVAEDSRHIFFQVFPDNKPRNKNNGGYEFQYRALKAGQMKAIYPAKIDEMAEFPVSYPNTWIRLKRVGNDFTGYWSADGRHWKKYTTYTLDLSRKLFVGPAVTSHNTKEPAEAIFRNLSLIQ